MVGGEVVTDSVGVGTSKVISSLVSRLSSKDLQTPVPLT
jgi:hypothetical protein